MPALLNADQNLREDTLQRKNMMKLKSLQNIPALFNKH